MIKFEIPGNPIALKRHRSVNIGKFVRQYDPSSKDKADFLAISMANKPDVPLSEPLRVDLIFWFDHPKSHYRTGKYSNEKKLTAPFWHTKVPDADNLAKFVCDALNGIFWKDDSCICDLRVTKCYADDYPRVSVHIQKAGCIDES